VKRGEIAIVAQRGLYEGKPRPAVIIQSDELLRHHPSILVCQLSTDPRAGIRAFFRIRIQPTQTNGLRETSVIMADRVVTIERRNIRETIGSLDPQILTQLGGALALIQGLR
jgi:mRNA interferase MazF